jgi:large subunit ribosomal protein L23Ae
LLKLLKSGKKLHNRKKWFCCRFHRPQTLITPKKPKYPKRAIPKRKKLDKYSILRNPMSTETIMKMIEDQNTLVFITDLRATKKQILNAFRKMYDVKVEKVRTLINTNGKKKAFIKLPKTIEAIEVASKIGIC